MSAEIRDKSVIKIISVCLSNQGHCLSQLSDKQRSEYSKELLTHIIDMPESVLWCLLPQEGKQELQEESILSPWESGEKKDATTSQMRWRLISGSLITCSGVQKDTRLYVQKKKTADAQFMLTRTISGKQN